MDQKTPGSNRTGRKAMMMHSTPGGYGLSTPIEPRESQQFEERIQLPGSAAGIGPNDVLCGRGKESFNHSGNKRFRETITNSLESYSKAESRVEKSLVVLSIFDGIRTRGGRFLKKDDSSGQWYELSDQQTKEKIAHAVRDAVNSTEARRKSKLKALGAKKPLDSEFKAGSPTMEDPSSGIYPSYTFNSAATSRTFPGSGTSHLASGGGASFYQNLEAAARDIRARHPSSASSSPAVARSTLRFSGLGDSFKTDQFGGTALGANTSGDLFASSAGRAGLGQLGNHSGSTLRASSYNLGQLSQDFNQGQAHLQPLSLSQASTSRLVSRQEPPSLSDPFLDHINQVLGPLMPEDHGDIILGASPNGRESSGSNNDNKVDSKGKVSEEPSEKAEI